MFNKIIDKEKIVQEMNTHSTVTLTNSRGKKISTTIYDTAYIKKGFMYLSFNCSPLEYFMDIDLDHILMYDKNKKELVITF